VGRWTAVSPFGALVAQMREEGLRRTAACPPEAGPPRSAAAPWPRSGLPEPDLRLETGAVSAPPPSAGRRKTGLLLVSIPLHGALLLAVIVVPLLMPDAFPSPMAATRAFFVEPIQAPPPPPPPPASRASAPPATAPRPRPPDDAAFTAPLATPDQIVPEQTSDLGLPGGVPGGVEGGVPGGVVGAVVGGLPEATPPPVVPVRVGGEIKEPRKVKNVEPVYPVLAARAHVQGVVILECIVSPQGRVVDVRVLRGNMMLDDAAIEAVRQWVYAPTLKDGVPIPVLLTATVVFQLKTAQAH
jgi:periplasmic protein TonB